ncbi:MAG: PHP domain-containing protein, partial [Planctomycetes bacterium]|nr:PHP domain-containing protein [Planctomycetota bacterium]
MSRQPVSDGQTLAFRRQTHSGTSAELPAERGAQAECTSAPDYAELHCVSNFSFLRGASHPEELVAQAAALGYRAIAITDRNSLAGVVRAHVAVKNRHEGTEARRHGGEENRHEGTEARRHGGEENRHEGTEARRHGGEEN